MRWTLTIKDQTYGTGMEIPKYACRVTRAGGIVRLTVENQGTGAVREGRFLMPPSVAKLLGDALLLAAGGSVTDYEMRHRKPPSTLGRLELGYRDEDRLPNKSGLSETVEGTGAVIRPGHDRPRPSLVCLPDTVDPRGPKVK